MATTNSAGLAIVVIGRNEGERLVRGLASIPRNIPIVYVDSASTDDSVVAAQRAGATVLPLDMARPFTAARARSEGVDLVNTRWPDTELVMFVDGDCELEANWLDSATAYLAGHPDVAVVCGRRRERFPGASFYNKLADWEWDTPIGDATACGGDSLMRLSAYRESGGFNVALIACEEPELCSRMRAKGWRIVRLDAAMTIHDAAMFRFGQWWRRGVRAGFGVAQAWWVTRKRGKYALYGRDLTLALGWSVVLPLACIALAVFVHPALFLLWPGIIAIQLLRWRSRVGIRHAALASIGHYAEIAGALRFAWRASRGSAGGTLTYK